MNSLKRSMLVASFHFIRRFRLSKFTWPGLLCHSLESSTDLRWMSEWSLVFYILIKVISLYSTVSLSWLFKVRRINGFAPDRIIQEFLSNIIICSFLVIFQIHKISQWSPKTYLIFFIVFISFERRKTCIIFYPSILWILPLTKITNSELERNIY